MKEALKAMQIAGGRPVKTPNAGVDATQSWYGRSQKWLGAFPNWCWRGRPHKHNPNGHGSGYTVMRWWYKLGQVRTCSLERLGNEIPMLRKDSWGEGEAQWGTVGHHATIEDNYVIRYVYSPTEAVKIKVYIILYAVTVKRWFKITAHCQNCTVR